MSYYLGIDTSNYTTSVALYSDEHEMLQKKKLLPVKPGACGLRQSDAVFHHVQQLPQMMELLLEDFEGDIAAVGVSSRPRDREGSYMPCFTVGLGTAQVLSRVLKVPLYTFSHQSGHIAAAIYSAGCAELLEKSFLAFHVSGGTTEAVLVQPDKQNIFQATIAAATLDLHAGQLVDRVGVMLGLDFPCGKELEKLAARYTQKLPKTRATLKGSNCCLSGIENTCRRFYETGASKEATAALCLQSIETTLEAMCRSLLQQYGELPVLFAGGVMSNGLIREQLSRSFDARFAAPEFSTDNAAGTAYLCFLKHTTYHKER